jgi:DNA-directed RNA polymerase alpha subunit
MTIKKSFTAEEAKKIGEELGIDWSKFDVEQFRVGMDVELEHGKVDPHTNVSDDDPLITGKIALAHLNEFPDYYDRLTKMEEEAEEYWGIED